MSYGERPDNTSLRMAAEVAAAWAAWVLKTVPPSPPEPVPTPVPSPAFGGGGFEAAVSQVVHALALVAASVANAGQGLTEVQLITFAKPLVVWSEGNTASFAVFAIKGDLMALNVDSVNQLAVYSTEDDHNDPVSVPAGTLAVATSDTPSVLTVGPQTPTVDAAGNATISFPLTIVAEGTANLSVTATNADGSPLLGPDGATPIAMPAPVAVNVAPGAAAEDQLTVPGN